MPLTSETERSKPIDASRTRRRLDVHYHGDEDLVSVAVPNDFDRSILTRVDHRPWAMPDGPWLMTQTWSDLLFAHWPLDPEALRPLIPGAFTLDSFDDRAWVGIVPFRMTNVGLRAVPSVRALSEFPELNVRTYVRVQDKPGVYFFSLDAGSALAVKAARILLNMPYFRAAMSVDRAGARVTVASQRAPAAAPAAFHATYEPRGPVFEPAAGSLEYFLTERYCLYNLDRHRGPYRLDIHHPPWPLQVASAAIEVNTMAAAAGIPLPSSPPLLLFAKRQDTVAWAPVSLHRD
jgi:uncharacterized protein